MQAQLPTLSLDEKADYRHFSSVKTSRRTLLRQLPAWALACSAPTALAQTAQAKPAHPLEKWLLLPEPSVMASTHSIVPRGALKTVFTPAREITRSPYIQAYPKAEFEALGISPESFAERARKAADTLLSTLQPEWIQEKDGKVLYAVYRGERPIYASLVVAPSLPSLYRRAFGDEIWLAAPDRHALYIFPAGTETLNRFIVDLQERYNTEAYAATSEIFTWKRSNSELNVVGNFDA